MEKEILGRECKFVTWLHAIPDVREDTHVVKEVIHYKDGTFENKLRIIYNYQRPFWVTKPHLQTYKEKKESEYLDNVNEYKSTQSDLGRAIASRLGGRYIGKYSLRDIKPSPFIYGIDVNSRTMIHKLYMERYPDLVSEYKVATLDIENDVDKGDITVISLAMKDKIYTVYTKSFVKGRLNTEEQLNSLFDKYIPKTPITEGIQRTFKLVENELEAVLTILKIAHQWEPDIIAIWNITYDLGKILDVLEANDIDPKDVFSDPRLPKELRHFKFKLGQVKKVTASGKMKPLPFEEQWHSVEAPAMFTWLDAGSTHRYVRVGGKTVPGGYSLDNILKYELGSKLGKLKFEDETEKHMSAIDWHRYMSKERPLHYIIYNNWDTISMLQLEDKTKDMSQVISLLSMTSNFDIFNSGPKKIIDAMHFFYLENGRVLGCKPNDFGDDYSLGLDEWINILPSSRVKENGLKCIEENPELITNVRGHVYDADQVSGYPSDGMAANVSKETTVKELISIAGFEKEDFKLENINLMFGPVNSVSYCNNMFNFPKIEDL